EKNIYATLDLSKSLSDFSSEVIKSLELTNINEWDGQILKQREEKIREVALILAGQCIAILLYNLSQSQLANQTAIIQTRNCGDGKTHRHGYRKWQIL
ncbi:MAG: ISLre2-like element ISCst1 family transposase, partial [Nostoc sp.]